MYILTRHRDSGWDALGSTVTYKNVRSGSNDEVIGCVRTSFSVSVFGWGVTGVC